MSEENLDSFNEGTLPEPVPPVSEAETELPEDDAPEEESADLPPVLGAGRICRISKAYSAVTAQPETRDLRLAIRHCLNGREYDDSLITDSSMLVAVASGIE